MSGNSIFVSVIVPVYNAAEHLKRCVDSILNSTLSNIELILVDDGSTDGSAALCDSFAADKRVRVIHKTNGGPCTARNKGIEAARGEYIGFADADDHIDKNMFAELYKAAAENDADIAFCDYIIEAEKSSRVAASDFNGDCVYNAAGVRDRLLPYFFGYTDSELAAYKSYFPFADYSSYVWLCIYRTSVIRENGIKFPSQSLYYNEDNLFNLNFIFHTMCAVHVAKPLYFYRDCGGSLTKRYNSGFLKAKLNKFEYLRRFISEKGCRGDMRRRLENKICIETINIINYYVNSKGLSFSKKLGMVRETISDSTISGAASALVLNGLPLSPLKIFLFFEKKKAAAMLLLLSEGHKFASFASGLVKRR